MNMNRLQITLEPKVYIGGVVSLMVNVDIYGKDELNYEVVIPEDDFMTRFEFAWRQAKRELDKFIEENREEVT